MHIHRHHKNFVVVYDGFYFTTEEVKLATIFELETRQLRIGEGS